MPPYHREFLFASKQTQAPIIPPAATACGVNAAVGTRRADAVAAAAFTAARGRDRLYCRVVPGTIKCEPCIETGQRSQNGDIRNKQWEGYLETHWTATSPSVAARTPMIWRDGRSRGHRDAVDAAAERGTSVLFRRVTANSGINWI